MYGNYGSLGKKEVGLNTPPAWDLGPIKDSGDCRIIVPSQLVQDIPWRVVLGRQDKGERCVNGEGGEIKIGKVFAVISAALLSADAGFAQYKVPLLNPVRIQIGGPVVFQAAIAKPAPFLPPAALAAQAKIPAARIDASSEKTPAPVSLDQEVAQGQATYDGAEKESNLERFPVIVSESQNQNPPALEAAAPSDSGSDEKNPYYTLADVLPVLAVAKATDDPKWIAATYAAIALARFKEDFKTELADKSFKNGSHFVLKAAGLAAAAQFSMAFRLAQASRGAAVDFYRDVAVPLRGAIKGLAVDLRDYVARPAAQALKKLSRYAASRLW